jgi:hypothetical protein
MMSCGDCDFETHYESELFLHLKIHMGKEDEVCVFFPVLRIHDMWVWIRMLMRIRILLFSSLTFKTPTKN